MQYLLSIAGNSSYASFNITFRNSENVITIYKSSLFTHRSKGRKFVFYVKKFIKRKARRDSTLVQGMYTRKKVKERK